MSLRRSVAVLFLSVIALCFTTGVSIAQADSSVKPLKGTFAGAGFTLDGQLMHLGRFTGQITSFVPSPDGGTTTATWTAANGDEVRVRSDFTVGGQDPSTCLYKFTQVITILGGTGRFSAATGHAIGTGETTPDFSTYHGKIDGTIGY
ncbi:MAG: hypothetical protein QOJ19_1994 [Acidimicrobiia bacterium]|nr:hypothetical protein [Acidimicrobiia bacterium]